MDVTLVTPPDLLIVYIVINVVTYIMSILAIIVNGGILLAYCIQKIRKPSYRLSPAGCLVINLLVADCLCGVVCISVTHFKMWPEHAQKMAKFRYLCPVRFVGGFLGFIGSHFALLCVVIDRYVAVLKTMQYRDWMTHATIFKMILGGWIIPFTGGLIIETKNEWHKDVKTCTENTIISVFLKAFWIPLTVLLLTLIVLIQAKVHIELSRQAKSESPLAVVLRRVTRNTARVLLQSTTIFIVCWGFFDCSQLTYVIFEHKWTKLVYDISFPVAISSYLSNPMLYSYKTKSINEPVQDLFIEIKNFILCRKDDGTHPSCVGHRASLPNLSPRWPGLHKKLSVSSQTVGTFLEYTDPSVV